VLGEPVGVREVAAVALIIAGVVTITAPYVLVVQIVVPVILAALVAGEGWGSTAAGGLVLGGGLVLTATGAGVLASAAAVADVIAARAPPQAPSPASASTSVAAEGNRP